MFMSGTVYWMVIVTKISWCFRKRNIIIYVYEKIKYFCNFEQQRRKVSQHKIYNRNWNISVPKRTPKEKYSVI